MFGSAARPILTSPVGAARDEGGGPRRAGAPNPSPVRNLFLREDPVDGGPDQHAADVVAGRQLSQCVGEPAVEREAEGVDGPAVEQDIECSFVVSNYVLGREEAFGDDDSFQEQGIIDSTGILELVSHLERTYGIEILDEELNPDNLDSVNKIAAYLTRKLSTVTAQPMTSRESAFSL